MNYTAHLLINIRLITLRRSYDSSELAILRSEKQTSLRNIVNLEMKYQWQVRKQVKRKRKLSAVIQIPYKGHSPGTENIRLPANVEP